MPTSWSRPSTSKNERRENDNSNTEHGNRNKDTVKICCCCCCWTRSCCGFYGFSTILSKLIANG